VCSQCLNKKKHDACDSDFRICLLCRASGANATSFYEFPYSSARRWLVYWNEKYYADWDKQDGKTIPQSLGLCKLPCLPRYGDRVRVGVSRKIYYEGRVVSNLTSGVEHQTDPSNRGSSSHRQDKLYYLISLQKVATPLYCGRKRRTWTLD